MIKYYGTPLSPVSVFDEALCGRNALIPFPRQDNMKRAIKICDKIILDNGAFSLWRSGKQPDWDRYYKWVNEVKEDIEFYLIPDVIDGSEQENNDLLRECRDSSGKGVPIWHVNESLERLEAITKDFDYIAIGSAGDYAQLGTRKWHIKMNDAMRVLCDNDGFPKVKIHMLRCLDSRIFTRYPFYSGDSTSLAQNHKTFGWKAIVDRVEKYDSPLFYEFKKYYETGSLFDSAPLNTTNVILR
jgi:hypothetical protein